MRLFRGVLTLSGGHKVRRRESDLETLQKVGCPLDGGQMNHLESFSWAPTKPAGSRNRRARKPGARTRSCGERAADLPHSLAAEFITGH